jgi:hypothetical protein
MEMGTETMKEDLMIIMVNSLVADLSLIYINNREKACTLKLREADKEIGR